MMLTKEDMQALSELMDVKLQPLRERQQAMEERLRVLESGQKGLRAEMERRFDAVDEELAEIKEEATITRHTTNMLLRWAEKADRTAVNVGLYPERK